ncbi:hypothetical protein GA0115253_107502 [Streptomyces sp. Termitarium-T10T-6]|nr:hypothetical protein GA0115253_107502 [Streptomyces sp. Termitarium-T10T-6]
MAKRASRAGCSSRAGAEARAGVPPGAVGWRAKNVPKTAMTSPARTSPAAGWIRTTVTQASAGPAMRPSSSTVVSKGCARRVNSLVCDGLSVFLGSVRTIHRVRESGPICGTVRPATAASAACTTSGIAVRAEATKSAMAAVLAREAARMTGRWPRRSARRPRNGPPTACPVHSIPAAIPAVPMLSSSVSIRRVAMGQIAAGRRAAKEIPGRAGPAIRVTVVRLANADT